MKENHYSVFIHTNSPTNSIYIITSSNEGPGLYLLEVSWIRMLNLKILKEMLMLATLTLKYKRMMKIFITDVQLYMRIINL